MTLPKGEGVAALLLGSGHPEGQTTARFSAPAPMKHTVRNYILNNGLFNSAQGRSKIFSYFTFAHTVKQSSKVYFHFFS